MKKVLSAFVIGLLLLQVMLTVAAYASPPDLEQHIFIHYAKNAKAKPPPSATNPGYYKLLGAKWPADKLPITLEVNPANSYGLSQEFVVEAIGIAAGEWDDGAYSQKDNDPTSNWGGVSVKLFGAITITNKGYDDLAWTSDKLDGENTIVWGNYPTSGVIAVTIVWSSRAAKTIIEFDMVLDTDYQWGNAADNSSVMDLQNIVTHELGHALGLGDVYQTAAWQETMYGYAAPGETLKRSLYIGDQTGITKLYGSYA